MKKYIPWIALLLVVFAAGFLWAKERGDKKLLEERLKAQTEKVALLTGQIAEAAAQVAKSEKALEKFQADSAAREKWFQGQLAHVATATPQQLVDDGSRLLGASDISTDGKTVTMGLETWRRAVSILLNEEEYRTVREPGWLNEKGMMNSVVSGLKQELLLRDQRDAATNEIIKGLKVYISSAKVSSLLDKVLYAGAGFGAGMLVHSIVR